MSSVQHAVQPDRLYKRRKEKRRCSDGGQIAEMMEMLLVVRSR